jgi:hypothetical protein
MLRRDHEAARADLSHSPGCAVTSPNSLAAMGARPRQTGYGPGAAQQRSPRWGRGIAASAVAGAD